MNVAKKAWAVGIMGALLLAGSPSLSWAASQTTPPIVVTANVPVVASLSVEKDPNTSVVRFSPLQIVFDRLDINDGQADGNAGFMYAPYRSEVNKNWHILRIFGNGANTSLTSTVSGTVGGVQLNTLLSVFCGGYFPVTGGGPLPGTRSPDAWELLATFNRNTGPFQGVASMNYQLNVQGVAAGPSVIVGGAVTYTLTST